MKNGIKILNLLIIIVVGSMDCEHEADRVKLA